MPENNSYPHPTLTKVLGRPTNVTLKLLQQEINTNAMSIVTNRGGGNHGHLALVIPATEYTIQAGVGNYFLTLTNPGNTPTHAPNATGPQITEINRQFKVDVKEFQHHNKVKNELKQQIIEAVDDKYINTLSDNLFGYANITVLTILQHLKTTYGAITPDDLAKNDKELQREWDPQTEIEDLWTHQEDCQQYAAAGTNPITQLTVIIKTLQLIENTGIF